MYIYIKFMKQKKSHIKIRVLWIRRFPVVNLVALVAEKAVSMEILVNISWSITQ